MSSQPKPNSGDALNSIAKFAFDAEEEIDDASQAQVDEILRKQGTDPEALVKKMHRFLNQQRAESLSKETEEKKASILSIATPVNFPALSVMQEAIVNYGFAARLEDEMTEEDIKALYQQIQILQDLNQGDEE